MKENKTENSPVEVQSEIAQAPPAPQDNGTPPASAGGCLPRPCSAFRREVSQYGYPYMSLNGRYMRDDESEKRFRWSFRALSLLARLRKKLESHLQRKLSKLPEKASLC